MTPPPTPRFDVPGVAFAVSVNHPYPIPGEPAAFVYRVYLFACTIEWADAAWHVGYWGNATGEDKSPGHGRSDRYAEARLCATVKEGTDKAAEALAKAHQKYIDDADDLFRGPIVIADADGKRWTSPFPYVDFVAVEEKG